MSIAREGGGAAGGVLVDQRDGREEDEQGGRDAIDVRRGHMVEGEVTGDGDQDDDVDEAAEHREQEAGEGAGDRGDGGDGDDDDDGEEEEIMEQSGDDGERVEAGVLEKVDLHEEEGQVDEGDHVQKLGGEELGPVIGAGRSRTGGRRRAARHG